TAALLSAAIVADAAGLSVTLSRCHRQGFYVSMRHCKPFCLGLNCALGATQMRPFLQRLAKVAECFVHVYSNAGLPNAMGGYDDTPEDMARDNLLFAEEGLINMLGGCCGSTPPHIKARKKASAQKIEKEDTRTPETSPLFRPTHARAVQHCETRPLPPPREPFMWLSGLEDLVVTKERFQFLNVGERCNVSGSIRFKKLILKGDYQTAMDVAKQQV
ncbi:unnamed protein product, partial [Hapterophycus canaliculatus]